MSSGLPHIERRDKGTAKATAERLRGDGAADQVRAEARAGQKINASKQVGREAGR